MREAMERNGWQSLEDFRGIRRDRVVTHSKIRRPEGEAYRGGYEAEGYAASQPTGADAAVTN
jgi:dihydropyrimidine dehydrogenase (NAD+) subunit PreA